MNIFNQLEADQYFEKGWNYGKGIPISKEVTDKAISLVDKLILLGYVVDDFECFPLIDGTTQVVIYETNRCEDFQVYVKPNGLYNLGWYSGVKYSSVLKEVTEEQIMIFFTTYQSLETPETNLGI